MSFFENIKEHGLDPNTLQNGFKSIGVDFSKYKTEVVNFSEDLIITLKKISQVDRNTSRQDKMFLRSNFESALMGKEIKIFNKIDLIQKKETEPKKNHDKNNARANVPYWNNQKLKIGKVKFFDTEKGFGFLDSFDDKQDCFVHVSRLQVPIIAENDIVSFESGPSKKKEGQLDAYSINTQFEIFVDADYKSKRSTAVILTTRHFSQRFQLTDKLPLGFYVATAKQNGLYWKLSVKEKESVEDKTKLVFCKQLFDKYLGDLNEYYENIGKLYEFVWNLIPDEEKQDYVNKLLDATSKLETAELEKCIDSFSTNDIRQTVFSKHLGKISKLSFLFWKKEITNSFPGIESTQDLEVWNKITVPLDSATVVTVINKLVEEKVKPDVIRLAYENLLNSGINIKDEQNFQELSKMFLSLQVLFPDVVITEDSLKAWSIHYIIRFYQAGLLTNINPLTVEEYLKSVSSADEKAEFIESLPEEKVADYYSRFPELSQRFVKFCLSKIDASVSNVPFIVFDLETKGDEITEFSFKDNTGLVKSDTDYKEKEKGIEELVSTLTTDKIIVGQNIKQYDIPILEKKNLKIDKDLVWDTLEIEFLLNPCRFSYGLKTTHKAIDDTETCYGLFYSQILRIALLPSDDAVLNYLPKIFNDYIEPIRNVVKKHLNKSIDPETLPENYLRPTLNKNILSEITISKLNEEFEKGQFNIIIAPAFLWDSLSTFPKVYFSGSEQNYNYLLNLQKVQEYKFESELHRTILINFISRKEQEHTLPYWKHLPVAIQILIGADKYAVLCDNKPDDILKIQGASFCIEPDNISALEKIRNKKANFIYLGRELHLITSKHQLGDDLQINVIFDKLKNEDVLLRMSGGKNYAKLDKRQCDILGITLPNYVRNVWMEKFKKGAFKVWCNTDLFNCLSGIDIKSIEAVESNAKKDNTFIVRPGGNSYSAEQYRLNPESLNRAMYWTYQLKIISELATKFPTVLLINDPEEINALVGLCSQMGFYVPDQNATLSRQIELLNNSNFPKRIIVTDTSNISRVLNANYKSPLNFIWDSFLLYEKNQMLGDVLDEITRDFEIENEEQLSEIPKSDNKGFDMFGLIKAHKPLINHFASLIKLNHPDSVLHLIDTRLTDFYGIESGFNVLTKKVTLWRTEAEYLDNFKNAKTFFRSENFTEVKFDIEEAKQVLANIFLRTTEETKNHYWFDYQEKYLNKILPAKDDILISLPTGAGKSLLFQAPSLYRSTFSNKLNIVVSPLRALMQDQVEALWDRGFISNVDFLSGDKSQMEIRDIYRRIAGGEITLLYITPERFRSKSFEKSLLIRLDADSGLEYVVFDEAHCISQWGQEFRPDYLNAGKKIAQFASTPPYQFRKLLFSATISEQVFEEITKLLPGIKTIEGVDSSYNPVRDHISINFKKDFDPDDRLTEVARYFKNGGLNPALSKAIIFVKSRKRAEEGALLMPDVLNNVYGGKCDFANSVGSFHAGMDVEDRKEVYEKYKSGDISILFATKAFGMGMDIPDIHFLSHFSPPSTFEDFLQEIGRAGRNAKKREIAGFNSTTNPIKAFCLADSEDFKKLKTQLHQSRITWEDIKSTKALLEKYISRFKSLAVDNDTPVAVPFTLASLDAGGSDDETDNKFRIALHWLEKLGRIKLGYFTITHLDIAKESVQNLAGKLVEIADEDVKKVCEALVALNKIQPDDGLTLQVPLSALRSETKFGLEKLFKNLLIAHKAGLIEMKQEIAAKHTEQRTAEVKGSINSTFKYYIALNVAFDFAKTILSDTPLNGSRIFEGAELESYLKEVIENNVREDSTYWINPTNQSGIEKNIAAYKKDLITKRSKHAFTIIRLLDKTKHESKLERTVDANRRIFVRQSLFNGYRKKEEWQKKLNQMKDDCSKLLNIISRKNINDNKKKFNWADLIKEGKFPENLQYVSDLFFILSVLGYIRTSSLLPSGIETYLTSLKPINENTDGSDDKLVFEEFKKTNEIRELKLIAMQALSGLEQTQHDEYIKKYFACNSLESLINMLQNYLPETDPVFQAFRGEAIKEKETGLNKEQRIVYDADINQNINVIAGPGSGKTHTLSLRAAKLVHHIGVSPDEILVLAYNRAVVSELKERLGKLFNDLGYSNIAKRLKIFTFHGLAKRFCKEEIGESDFSEWEEIFLHKLTTEPGIVLNQLGKIKHILVDEFQDINDTRLNVLSKLINLTEAKIFIIGDPNQSIYGYDRNVTDPYHYYEQFNEVFKPVEFSLVNNHRSYPDILTTASRILRLSEGRKNLIPVPIKKPDDRFIKPYVEIFDDIKSPDKSWTNAVAKLLNERHPNGNGELKPYNQIAILFRSNNEVYKGFQALKGLDLQNVRIRIQGGLQYEFTRLRECFELIEWLKIQKEINKRNLLQDLRGKINELINQFPKWNHFYLRVVHAIVLDYFEQDEEKPSMENLIEFITELSYKDDGQLYKIYEKHIGAVSNNSTDTEIVLTTMHKVKGLEFDAVITVPSITALGNSHNRSIEDEMEEERRLAFVSYTRAKYRLVINLGDRERALINSEAFDQENINYGFPVEPKLNKHVLNSNAKEYMFVTQKVNEYIRTEVKTGDLVSIQTKRVQQWVFKELVHNGRVVGTVSTRAVENLEHIESVKDFVVNEIVMWSFNDTKEYDERNDTKYQTDWCDQAKQKGFIYIVDFAGFGKTENSVL